MKYKPDNKVLTRTRVITKLQVFLMNGFEICIQQGPDPRESVGVFLENVQILSNFCFQPILMLRKMQILHVKALTLMITDQSC